jgi:hypothetical protein
MTCSVAIPTTAITTAIIAWWIDEKIPKNGSINALLTTIKATQLGWRCWAKDERKLSVFLYARYPLLLFHTRQDKCIYTRQYVSYRYTTVNYTSTCYNLFFFLQFPAYYARFRWSW